MFRRAVRPRHESQIVSSLQEFSPAREEVDEDYVPALRGITYGPIWLRTCSCLAGPENHLPAFSTMELRISRVTGIETLVSHVDQLNIGTLAIQDTELHFLFVPSKACEYKLATEVAAMGVWKYLQGYDTKESIVVGDMVALANAHEMRTLEEVARIRAEFEQSQITDQERIEEQSGA